jgi:hypothetical protein
MPIATTTALLLAAAGASAAGAAGQGIYGARAAKKMGLTKAEEQELTDIQKRLQRGESLTESQRGALETRFLTEQAAAQRQLEASALQQSAARGLGGPVSGREIFLQEMAEAGTQRQIQQQRAGQLAEAEAMARAEDKARKDMLVAQQKQAEAARQQAIASALGAAGSGISGALTSAAAVRGQVEAAEAATPVQDTQALLDLFRTLQQQQQTQGYTFGGLLD